MPSATGAALARNPARSSTCGSDEAVFGEVLLHRLAPSRALGADQHARAAFRREKALQRGERIVGAAVDLHGRQRHRARRDAPGASARRVARQFDARERLERAVERVRRQEQLGRRQQRPRLVAAQQLVARLRCPARSARSRRATSPTQRDGGVARQVVGERRGLFEEQRQVVLDAAGHDAVAHVLVERRLRRIAFEHFAIAAAKARAARPRRAEIRAPAAGARRAPGRACAACRRRTS